MMEFDFDITALKDQLDGMLLESSENERKVRRIIGQVLEKARGRISQRARAVLGSDPRGAYKAVKRSVYKRILGGSVSILDRRRAGSMRLREPERTLRPGQRGGNRIKRSARTEEMMSYQGGDRAFVLRFISSGTGQRRSRYGNRGSIGGRGWFEAAAKAEMEAAAEELCREILKLVSPL